MQFGCQGNSYEFIDNISTNVWTDNTYKCE